MATRALLVGLVLVTLTCVGVKGQPADLMESKTFWTMEPDDRMRFLAALMANNIELTQRMFKIAESLRWMVEATNKGSDPVDKAVVPFLLDSLPSVFNSSLFKLVFSVASDEVKRAPQPPDEVLQYFKQVTHGKMMEILAQNPNMSEELRNKTMVDIMTKQVIMYKLKNTNWFRAVNRVLLYGSARDLLFELNDTVSTVNPQCYSDTMDFIDAVVGTEHPKKNNGTEFDIRHAGWALKMLDSFGKPAGGVMKGAVHYVGSYDECLSVHAYLPNDTTMNLGYRIHNRVTEYDTRFCRVTFDLPNAIADSFGVDTRGIQLRLHWGMCFPDTCHSEDVAAMFKLGKLAQFDLPVHSVYCSEEEHIEDDTPALVGLIFILLIVLMVVVSTLYEAAVIFYNNNFAPVAPKSTGPPRTASTIELQVAEGGRPVYVNQAYVPDAGEKKVPFSGKATGVKEDTGVQILGYVKHKEAPPSYNDVSGTPSASASASNGDAVQGNGTVTSTTSFKAPPQEEENRHRAKSPKLVKAFSMLSNMPKILSGKKSPNAIHCLHGIRVFSLLWVILGHTYNYGIVSVIDNPTTVNLVDADAVFHRFTFQGVMAGGFAVDTFFLLSGLLVTWLTLKDMAKRKAFSCPYWIMFYVHRFWRLTPLYMIVLMFFTCLHKYVGGGPLWPERLDPAMNCRTYWWTNFLYVNNIVHVDDMCMGWTWYLSNDMQFYVISPIFLLLLHYVAPFGVAMVMGLGLAGIASAFYFEHKNGGDVFTMHEDDSKYWEEVYVTPWCRVAAYAVGMMLGYILYKTKRTTLSMWKAVVGWVITWCMGLLLCYVTYTERQEGGKEWTLLERSFFESLSRPLWACCVGWIIFACYNNRGGFINSILSWEGFLPLSRLTYAAYLIHPIIMMLHLYSKKALVYIDDMGMVYLFMGHTVTSFLAAFLLSVACEAPALSLEKFFFKMR